MARDRDRDDEKGASLKSKDAIAGGGAGLGPGRTVLKKLRFALFDYRKKGERRADEKTALVIDMERDGEKAREPYSVGSGFTPSSSGLKLVGKEGLPDNCNAHYFFDSLEASGMSPDFWDDHTIKDLDGIEVELKAKPIERDFRDQGGVKKKSLLIVSEVYDAPWKKGGKGAKAKDEDEEDEKPKSRRSRDDDDEEEKPRRSRDRDRDEDDEKPRSAKGKPNGKADEEDADVDEEAIEAMIEVLKDAKGPLKVKDLEDEIRTALKGNPQKNVIAARCTEDELLEQEKGWTYSKKKGIVELD